MAHRHRDSGAAGGAVCCVAPAVALREHQHGKSLVGSSLAEFVRQAEELCALQSSTQGGGDVVQNVSFLVCSSLDSLAEQVGTSMQQQQQQLEDADTLGALLQSMAHAASAARAAISSAHSPHSQDQQLAQLTISAFAYLRHVIGWLQQVLAVQEGRAACLLPCSTSSCILLTSSVMHAARTSLFSTRLAQALGNEAFRAHSEGVRSCITMLCQAVCAVLLLLWQELVQLQGALTASQPPQNAAAQQCHSLQSGFQQLGCALHEGLLTLGEDSLAAQSPSSSLPSVLRTQKNVSLAWKMLTDLLCRQLPAEAAQHLASSPLAPCSSSLAPPPPDPGPAGHQALQALGPPRARVADALATCAQRVAVELADLARAPRQERLQVLAFWQGLVVKLVERFPEACSHAAPHSPPTTGPGTHSGPASTWRTLLDAACSLHTCLALHNPAAACGGQDASGGAPGSGGARSAGAGAGAGQADAAASGMAGGSQEPSGPGTAGGMRGEAGECAARLAERFEAKCTRVLLGALEQATGGEALGCGGGGEVLGCGGGGEAAAPMEMDVDEGQGAARGRQGCLPQAGLQDLVQCVCPPRASDTGSGCDGSGAGTAAWGHAQAAMPPLARISLGCSLLHQAALLRVGLSTPLLGALCQQLVPGLLRTLCGSSGQHLMRVLDGLPAAAACCPAAHSSDALAAHHLCAAPGEGADGSAGATTPQASAPAAAVVAASLPGRVQSTCLAALCALCEAATELHLDDHQGVADALDSRNGSDHASGGPEAAAAAAAVAGALAPVLALCLSANPCLAHVSRGLVCGVARAALGDGGGGLALLKAACQLVVDVAAGAALPLAWGGESGAGEAVAAVEAGGGEARVVLERAEDLLASLLQALPWPAQALRQVLAPHLGSPATVRGAAAHGAGACGLAALLAALAAAAGAGAGAVRADTGLASALPGLADGSLAQLLLVALQPALAHASNAHLAQAAPLAAAHASAHAGWLLEALHAMARCEGAAAAPAVLQACQSALHNALGAFAAAAGGGHDTSSPTRAPAPHHQAYLCAALRLACFLSGAGTPQRRAPAPALLPPSLQVALAAVLSPLAAAGAPAQGSAWPSCVPHAVVLAMRLLLVEAAALPAVPDTPSTARLQLFLLMQQACLPAPGGVCWQQPARWLLQHEALQAVVAASRCAQLQPQLAALLLPCLHPPLPGTPPSHLALTLLSYSHNRVQPALLASLPPGSSNGEAGIAATAQPARHQRQDVAMELYGAVASGVVGLVAPWGGASRAAESRRQQQHAAALLAVEACAAELLGSARAGGGVSGDGSGGWPPPQPSTRQSLAHLAVVAGSERQAAWAAQLDVLRAAVQQLVTAAGALVGSECASAEVARLLGEMGGLASSVSGVFRQLEQAIGQ